MKKQATVIMTVTALLLFTMSMEGCINLGGGSTAGSTSSTDQRTKLYDTSAYSISIPKEWDVIEKKDFTSDVPAVTVVVFRNNVKNETYTANINIVQNKLQEPMPSLEYAKRVTNRQSSGLFNYTESRKDSTKISIGGSDTDTYYTLFEAKKSQEDKTIRYLQTYAVKGEDAYIVTGSVSPQEDANMIKTVEDTVKSFKLK